VSETVDQLNFNEIDYLPVGWDEKVDKVLVGLLNKYNELVAERNLLLASRVVTDPAVTRNAAQVIQLKQQIFENLQFQNQTNDTLLDFIQGELNRFTQRRRNLPLYEEQYSTLSNDYKVNEMSYAQLLNKQLETSIVQSGIIPSFKIINLEKVEHLFPKRAATLSFFAILGLFSGCILVLLIRSRNKTFWNIEELPTYFSENLISVIPHRQRLKEYRTQFVLELIKERSVFTESLKTLRMQLALKHNKEEQGKVIVITSAAAHEGKSFVAFNLGVSMARLGKRVLLVDADLRRPSLHTYFNIRVELGLQDYLIQKADLSKELVQNTLIPNLDCIYSLPNEDWQSTELLMSSQMNALLQWAKDHYDVVLIDTAPVGLVADAYALLPKADNVLFIVRWLYSKHTVGKFAHTIQTQLKLANLRLVINDYYKDSLYIPFDDTTNIDTWTPGYYGKSKQGDGYYHSY
jgi:capsular exopolysaccharide synthesis family protein